MEVYNRGHPQPLSTKSKHTCSPPSPIYGDTRDTREYRAGARQDSPGYFTTRPAPFGGVGVLNGGRPLNTHFTRDGVRTLYILEIYQVKFLIRKHVPRWGKFNIWTSNWFELSVPCGSSTIISVYSFLILSFFVGAMKSPIQMRN